LDSDPAAFGPANAAAASLSSGPQGRFSLVSVEILKDGDKPDVTSSIASSLSRYAPSMMGDELGGVTYPKLLVFGFWGEFVATSEVGKRSDVRSGAVVNRALGTCLTEATLPLSGESLIVMSDFAAGDWNDRVLEGE
jgi:hypothetical protein